MSNTKKTPALAHFAAKEITPFMASYVAWLEQETGYKVDPLSVQLSGVLRPMFQSSEQNQQRLAQQAAAKAEREQAKLLRKLERDNADAEKAAQPAPAATPTRKASDPQAQGKSPAQPRSAATRGPRERGAQMPAKAPAKRAPRKAAAPATEAN